MTRNLRDPAARSRIAEVAWRVVADQGLEAASMRTIAAEAGVTTGSITHYFEDKHELLGAVLTFNNELAARRLFASLARPSVRDDAVARVGAAVEQLLPYDEERRRIWQVWVAFWTAPATDDLAGGLNAGHAGLLRTLQGLLKAAVDDGSLREELDIAFEAERLAVVVAGLGLYSGVGPASRVKATAKRMLTDHLERLQSHSRSLNGATL